MMSILLASIVPASSGVAISEPVTVESAFDLRGDQLAVVVAPFDDPDADVGGEALVEADRSDTAIVPPAARLAEKALIVAVRAGERDRRGDVVDRDVRAGVDEGGAARRGWCRSRSARLAVPVTVASTATVPWTERPPSARTALAMASGAVPLSERFSCGVPAVPTVPLARKARPLPDSFASSVRTLAAKRPFASKDEVGDADIARLRDGEAATGDVEGDGRARRPGRSRGRGRRSCRRGRGPRAAAPASEAGRSATVTSRSSSRPARPATVTRPEPTSMRAVSMSALPAA